MIKVTASFDDGSIYDMRLANIMYNFNIPTTFYIPADWRKYLLSKEIEPMTENQLRELAREFEIGSHSVNHTLLTRVDTAEQKYQIEESRLYLKELVNQNIDKFCYPRGYFNEDIKTLVKNAGYTEARTTLVAELNPPTDRYARNTTLHVGLDRREYGTDWLNFGRKMIYKALEKEAIGEDVDFHFWGHSEEIHRNQQWENLLLFLEELNENILS